MSKSRKQTLGQLIKTRDAAARRLSALLKQKDADRHIGAAIDAKDKAFSALCRYRPGDADELVQWLSAVLADEEVTGESIQVLDGLAALTSMHNSLSRLLVPASMHAR